MRTDDLDFHLPPHLVAQTPADRREDARLLHYVRATGAVSHRRFADLPTLLRAGDLLAMNDSRVLPARFSAARATGGRVDGLFLAQLSARRWHVMLKSAPPPGNVLQILNADGLVAKVEEKRADGTFTLAFEHDVQAVAVLKRAGRMPLPPYIRRGREVDPLDALDRERYQTVYAAEQGSVAAPTAGLHFTSDILAALAAQGVERAFVTLHVGRGTFKPVEADDLDAHQMHEEAYSVSRAAAAAVNRAQAQGRRIVAVGTTTARVLESLPAQGEVQAHSASTRIFIRPPYAWKRVGALLTNFHLPRSTLVALVAAMTGLEAQRRIYQDAVERGYRFFSYGDAMLIE